MVAAKRNIIITVGDDYDWSLKFSDSDGVINFTGWAAALVVRRQPKDTVKVLELLSSNSGITLDSSGNLIAHFEAVDTADLLGQYVFDLQLTNPSSAKKTYIKGYIFFVEDVTR